MSEFKKASWFLFHIAVAAMAVTMLALAVFPPVYAQTQTATQIQINELERRISGAEAVNTDHRLTAIETLLAEQQRTQESEATMYRYSLGATGLLLSERVYAALRRKLPKIDPDSETD